jgi:hypothetical protein
MVREMKNNKIQRKREARRALFVDMAVLAKIRLEKSGYEYRIGVIKEAVSAAMRTKTDFSAIDAFERVFKQFKSKSPYDDM